MARDRQRAKQRKARRARNPGPAPSQPYRTDVPGELEHSSGDVDEFEAAIVQGADGVPVDAEEAFGEEEDPEAASHAFGEAPAAPDEVEEEDEDDEQELDTQPASPAGTSDAELEHEAVAVARRPHPGAPTQRGAGRFVGFLRASWSELQRVQWPDRRQVAQATGVVIGFVIVAGLYLGLADFVAKKIVNAII